MRNDTRSRYDYLFESLAFHLKRFQSPFLNTLDIEITKLDGYVKFVFDIDQGDIGLKANRNKPFLTIWSDWDAAHPFTPTSKTSPITVEYLTVEESVKIRVTIEDGHTNFYIDDLDHNVGKLKLTFCSLNSIIPISEWAPFNRYVLPMNFQFAEDLNNPLLIRVIREVNVISKFTKGNHSFAFPSRQLSEKRITNLYFDKQESYFLKFGVSDGDFGKMTIGLITLLQTGVIFLIVGLLLNLKFLSSTYGTISSILGVIGSIIVLFFSLVREISNFFYTSRFKYYTHLRDFNNFLTVGSIFSLFIGILLIFSYFLDPTQFVEILLFYIFIITGSAFFLFAVIVLLLVRIGFLEKYICDVPNCVSKINNRYTAHNCFLNGRVICKKHLEKICCECRVYKESSCRKFEVSVYDQLDCKNSFSQK